MNVKDELVRNTTGYFLLTAGLVAMVIAHHIGFDKLVETGAGLVSAALFAFQHRSSSPDATATPKD
jgi:hypothetical protein